MHYVTVINAFQSLAANPFGPGHQHTAVTHLQMIGMNAYPHTVTELAIARADGRYPKLLASIAKTEVLIIDDWGLAKLNAENRRDLLEIIEDRHGIRSTVATSQLPLENGMTSSATRPWPTPSSTASCTAPTSST